MKIENRDNLKLATLIENLLQNGLCASFRVTGSSMKPFLQGGENILLEKICGKISIGDLVFFKNGKESVFLHRVISMRRSHEGGFILTTKGDANLIPEAPIPIESVIGKVKAVESPDAGRIEMDWLKYRIMNSFIGRREWCRMSLAKLRRKMKVIRRSKPGSVTEH